MTIDQLIETARNMWDDLDTQWYLTMAIGGYVGKLLVEFSGFWDRRITEINNLYGAERAEIYRSKINKINSLQFPIDAA